MKTEFSVSRLVALLAVSVLSVLSGVALAGDSYTVVELGPLKPNGSSVGRQMDNAGVRAVGSSGWTHGPDTRAFVWTAPTGMRDLGTFPGGDYSEAFGINDSGTVVGDSNTRDTMLAFVWSSPDGMRELSP